VRLDDTKDFNRFNCRWGYKNPGRPLKKVKQRLKNKYISLSINLDMYEFIKKQSIHKSLELGKIVQPNEMIREALQIAFPTPKQYDMFGVKN
jgi:hypothetical protein